MLYMFSSANTENSLFHKIHFVIQNVQAGYSNTQIGQMINEIKEQKAVGAEVSVLKMTGLLLCTGRSRNDKTWNKLAPKSEKWCYDNFEPMGDDSAYGALMADCERNEGDRVLSLTYLRHPFLKNNIPPMHMDAGMSLIVNGYPDGKGGWITPKHKKHKMPGCSKGIGVSEGWTEFWRIRGVAAGICYFLRKFCVEYIAGANMHDMGKELFMRTVTEWDADIRNGGSDLLIAQALGMTSSDHKVCG
jgi:hypothetical protein